MNERKKYVYIRINTYTSTYIYIYICVYIYVYASMYTSMCVRMYVRMNPLDVREFYEQTDASEPRACFFKRLHLGGQPFRRSLIWFFVLLVKLL